MQDRDWSSDVCSSDLAHDRVMYPTPTHNSNGILRWEGSDAETFLRADVEAGASESGIL